MPVILVILTGYFLKRVNLFSQDFFKGLNRLCFRCCLPILLFFNVYKIDNFAQVKNYSSICFFTVLSVVVSFIIAFIIFGKTIKDPKQKGVMIQSAFRSNYAIIGISLVQTMCNGDNEPLIVAALLSSVAIPLFNVLAIISLTAYVKTDGKKISIMDVISKIFHNPLILGVLTGLAVLVIRSFIPVDNNGVKLFTIKNNLPFVYSSISMLAQSATPLALLSLGGTFTFNAVKRLKKLLIISCTLRVIISPALWLTVAYMAGFRYNEMPALIAIYGTPIAVSSVPMASEMGNDDELAGQIVVWTSVLSMFSLFAIIYICTLVGIFNV